MAETNRQVRLRARPDGIPQARHFEVVEAPLGPLAEGRFRVRNSYLSVDPAMRGWVSEVANYSTPVAIGEVMRSFAVGEVVESRHPEYAPGERLVGVFGWQHFADSDGQGVIRYESATVGGIAVPQTVAQELLRFYTRTPERPRGFAFDEPFALPAGLRAVSVERGAATVTQ